MNPSPPKWGRPAPSAAAPQQSHLAPVPPANNGAPPVAAPPTTPAAQGRRVASEIAAPPPPISAGIVGQDPIKSTTKLLQGTYFCHVSQIQINKYGQPSLKVRIHKPGDESIHGTEVFVEVAEKSGKAQVHSRRRIAEMFAASGWPETKWPTDSAGKRIVPYYCWFVHPSVEIDGKRFAVPLMLEGKFSIDDPSAAKGKDGRARDDGGNPLEKYQRIESLKPVEPFLIAPLPRFCIPWIAVDLYGWPCSVEPSKFEGGHDTAIIRGTLLDSLVDDHVFSPRNWGRLLGDGDPSKEMPFV